MWRTCVVRATLWVAPRCAGHLQWCCHDDPHTYVTDPCGYADLRPRGGRIIEITADYVICKPSAIPTGTHAEWLILSPMTRRSARQRHRKSFSIIFVNCHRSMMIRWRQRFRDWSRGIWSLKQSKKHQWILSTGCGRTVTIVTLILYTVSHLLNLSFNFTAHCLNVFCIPLIGQLL
jgi:uncharacterized membrane protein